MDSTPRKSCLSLSDDNFDTPRKSPRGICTVCGKKGVEFRLINSAAGREKKLSDLIHQICGYRFIEGCICRACEAKILTLSHKIIALKDQCCKTVQSLQSKRTIKNTPVKSGTGHSSTPARLQETKTPKRRKLTFDKDKENHKPRTPSKIPTRVRTELEAHHSYGKQGECRGDKKGVAPSRLPRPIQVKGNGPMQKGTPVHSTSTPVPLDHTYVNSPVVPVASDIVKRLSREIKNAKELELRQRNDDQYYAKLRNRKLGHVSVLMAKDTAAMVNLDWERVVEELCELFPEFANVLVGLMLEKEDRHDPNQIQAILPKLGLIYGIVAQCRNDRLSLVQRTLSAILTDALCDVKVIDQLASVGVCMSYSTTQRILESVTAESNAKLVRAMQAGRKFRLIGDNVNFYVGVRDERHDKHSHLQHYFASAAILLPQIDLSPLSDTPEKITLELGDLIPTPGESDLLTDDYAYICMKVAAKHLGCFAFLQDLLPEHLTDQYSHSLLNKTEIVPLVTLHKNEQYYSDVVDILKYYEKLVTDVCAEAGVPPDRMSFHIGGDQLTRERFSGAKLLFLGAPTPKLRFDHLKPITAELFHLSMNFLTLAYHRLYHVDSGRETGTMKAEQDRIQRKSVKGDAKKAYYADKEYFESFTDAYIVEAVCEYFGLEDILSSPTNYSIPFDNADRLAWATKHFTSLVKQFVGTFAHRNDFNTTASCEDCPDGYHGDIMKEHRALQVRLGNGKLLTILVRTHSKADPQKEITDRVKTYGQLVLELGLVFRNFHESISIPNRPRMLRTLKLMMTILKANNNLSKYADEILRFVVCQQHILPEKEAYQVFYGLFVNTRGKLDSHIPCDLAMEWLVRVTKRHIKHMMSNKTEKNIERKTQSLACLMDISKNFQKASSVMVRSKQHKTASSLNDERLMIEDLRTVKPFTLQDGRYFPHFENSPKSLLALLDYNRFRNWLGTRSQVHATSLAY